MALIECNECGREISDKAQACPGCGAPVSSCKGAPDTQPSTDRCAATYYLLIDDEQQGPFNLAQIRAKLESGDVSDDTLYAKPGMEDWQPLSSLQTSPRPNPRQVDRPAISLLVGSALLVICGIASQFRDKTPNSGDPLRPLMNQISLTTGGRLDTEGIARANRSGEAVTTPVGTFQRIKGVNRHKLAYQAATNIVNRFVVSPGTARYSPFNETQIDGSRKLFRVTGYVDSENRAGALLRSEFDLYMDYNAADQRWVSVKLTFDFDE